MLFELDGAMEGLDTGIVCGFNVLSTFVFDAGGSEGLDGGAVECFDGGAGGVMERFNGITTEGGTTDGIDGGTTFDLDLDFSDSQALLATFLDFRAEYECPTCSSPSL